MKVKEGKSFFGRTLDIEHGSLKMSVTLDVGPRIISLSYGDSPNIMFVDAEKQIQKDVQEIFGKDETWYIYGGHRIWASPEEESTYIPDNGKVRYEVFDNAVLFTPEEWKVVKLQSSLKLTFLNDNSVKIDMSLLNNGESKRLALWGLTVLLPGGKFVSKLPSKDTGYLPNRNIVLWPYSSLLDSRFTLTDEEIILISNATTKQPFKVGFFTDSGSISYSLFNCVFTKSFVVKEGEYPDMNCNVETYASHLIHEVETLSPLVTLKRGESVSHEEIWTLTDI